MRCDFVYCIYNESFTCLLNKIEINSLGQKLGHKGIALGIDEGLEEFYAKLGYIGKTLIQSEKYSVEELKKFNEQYKNYEVTGSGVYDGYVNQLWINASLLDKELKKNSRKKSGIVGFRLS